jgi:outer membrane protein assembly factor BamB
MTTRLLLAVACTGAVALSALAADWPQYRGPDRTGVSKETGLLKKWPNNGPPLAWTYKGLGLGFSSISVVGDRLYTLGALDEVEYLIALDVKGAKVTEAWKAKIGPIFTFKENIWGDGPRSTPTVDGELIYTLSGYGELVCVDTRGKEQWRKDLVKQLDGEMMSEWGYSESVLIDGDLLICSPGGDKGTLAALNKKTGTVVWRSADFRFKAPYSSIMPLEVGGVRQYVQAGYISDDDGAVVLGVDAKTGKGLWTHPFIDGHSYALATTPIIKGNLVYVTTAYEAGKCHLLEVTPAGKGFTVKDHYSKRIQLKVKNQHGGVVLVGEHVYGHSDGIGWFCQDLKTGVVAWSDRNRLETRSGSILAADGMLYLYSEGGTVVLLEANPKGWQEHGRFDLPMKSNSQQARPTGRSSGIWAHPTIANGRLYLRDQELLFCFDIKK